jgi:hypothetical protein
VGSSIPITLGTAPTQCKSLSIKFSLTQRLLFYVDLAKKALDILLKKQYYYRYSFHTGRQQRLSALGQRRCIRLNE